MHVKCKNLFDWFCWVFLCVITIFDYFPTSDAAPLRGLLTTRLGLCCGSTPFCRALCYAMLCMLDPAWKEKRCGWPGVGSDWYIEKKRESGVGMK